MSVCIVIPVYKERTQLTSYEEISLKQCFKILSGYSIFYVGPAHLDWSAYHRFAAENNCNTSVKIFPDKYFSGIGGYSRLLVSVQFYSSFLPHSHLLIYQTDAFVFYDNLQYWSDKNFDYVGAPWFENFSSTDANALFQPGGNGGFSLRKIESHLKVLKSFSYINRPAENWKKRMSQSHSFPRLVREVGGFLLDLVVRNNTWHFLNSFKGFEDQFWCLVAARNFAWFNIPGYLEAMDFAIEMQPRRVYALNQSRLPFGCHAWWKYDVEFWTPFIEKFGYTLKDSKSPLLSQA